MTANDNLTPHSSAEYDAKVLKMLPHYSLFHSETIDLIKSVFGQPSVWLDTGCGTGLLIEKAIAVFPRTRFILSDPSEAMLAIAGNRPALSDFPNVTFLKPGTTADLPLQSFESPEIITALQSHHYMNRDEREKSTKVCYELLTAPIFPYPFGSIWIC